MLLSNKKLLITGGTGSFGRQVAKYFLATDIAEIRIFSRDEKKQEEMRNQFTDHRVRFFLGDVRDYTSIHHATKGVDYLFHAAALKQVPSCEFYPLEAIKTNILGAENVMSASLANNVQKVVVLSTDKAVYPINAMGQTKALMEKVMIAKSRSLGPNETVLCGTRYGNVMASRGSVIPLFGSQILQGQALTITDPSMTRFLMSLEDSVSLVMHAFQNGSQGDMFVQKAPASTIADLAQAMLNISGKSIEVRSIGTRHGEKLYESLVSREEMAKAEDIGKYYRIPSDSRDLNYSAYITDGKEQINNLEDYTSHNAQRLSVTQVEELLLTIEYIKKSFLKNVI